MVRLPDVEILARSRRPNRGEVRRTIDVLRSGGAVAWRGDQRLMAGSARKVADAVPEHRARLLVLDDTHGERVLLWWRDGDPQPGFSYAPGN